MSVRVYVTGRVRIEYTGRLIDEPRFPARQGRTLFVYLVCHRLRPVTRSELAEVLWPGSLPDAWDAALNALISKLRTLLGTITPANRLALANSSGGYALQVADDVWIDREAMMAAIDQAEGSLRADRWREAWAPVNIAAITARQPFLAGDEGEWIDRERARMHNVLLRALDCLVDVSLLNGEMSISLGAAREAVKLEPFREAGYRRLMRVHVALGDRAEALRVYEQCRTLLARELDTKPSQETEELFQELRR